MKVAFKFRDGTKVTVNNFSNLPRERTGEDLFDVFQQIKDNNSEIVLNDNVSGETITRTGHDLMVVELIME